MMSTLVLIGVFVCGAITGAVAMYLWRLRSDESGTLRRKLADAEAESSSFRMQVDEHFERTSALFQEVTRKYRSLHDHLAQGATGLTSRPQQLPAADIPERALIDAVGDDAPAQSTESVDDSAGADAPPKPPAH